MFDKYLYLGPMGAVNLIKLTTTFIAQSTVNYHYVSLLLSVRAAKTGPSIVLRLNYVNVHVWPINESDKIYNNVHCTINCQRLQEEISSLPNQKLDSHNTIFSYIKVP